MARSTNKLRRLLQRGNMSRAMEDGPMNYIWNSPRAGAVIFSAGVGGLVAWSAHEYLDWTWADLFGTAFGLVVLALRLYCMRRSEEDQQAAQQQRDDDVELLAVAPGSSAERSSS